MVILALSPTYRQLWALSVEKFIDTAVPIMLVWSLTNCSARKPHVPTLPVGLLQGLPSVGSFLSNTWRRSFPRSQTYSFPSLAIFTQCTGFRKKAGLRLPLVESAIQVPAASADLSSTGLFP